MSHAPLFDPAAPAFLENPYTTYARLRREDPWHRSPFGFLVASRFADIDMVLRDRRFGKSFKGPKANRLDSEIGNMAIFRSIGQWMLESNPPDHTRRRACFAKSFTAKRVEAMLPQIEAIVDDLLDDLAPRGEMDVMADFAQLLPFRVITDLIGVPKQDQHALFKIARFIGRLSDPVPLDRAELAQIDADFIRVADYFRGLIDARTRQPREDLVSQIAATAPEQRLSIDEMAGNLVLLFVAGHETSTNLIGNALLALARNPDQLDLLRSERGLMQKAVTECLRYDNPIQIASRTALHDVAFGDVEIAGGQDVLLLLGSANRDPAMYAEPDRLDLTRSESQLLSFGGGIHFCLGAQLSRIEVECALDALLHRLPGFRLDDPLNPVWRPSVVFRGPARLLATWTR
jgi:cytochrome P450